MEEGSEHPRTPSRSSASRRSEACSQHPPPFKMNLCFCDGQCVISEDIAEYQKQLLGMLITRFELRHLAETLAIAMNCRIAFGLLYGIATDDLGRKWFCLGSVAPESSVSSLSP